MLTDLETQVLKAFNTYKTAEATKSDLGVSWTDTADLAKATGLELATVVGVVGSLVKKDLVQTDEAVTGVKPSALCLTDLGVDAFFSIANGTPVELADETAAFRAALIKAGADEEHAKNMGIPFPGIICATLRNYAGVWTGSRKAFIQTAQLAGFNRFTAQTQWQRARG